MGRAYPQAYDGLWYRTPIKRRLHLACCDCGLVHVLEHKLTRSGRLYVKYQREVKETARLRKLHGKKLVCRPKER